MLYFKPTEQIRQTAFVDWIYTPAYLSGLERRMSLAQTQHQFRQTLQKAAVSTIQACFKKIKNASPARPNPLVSNVGSIDKWKK